MDKQATNKGTMSCRFVPLVKIDAASIRNISARGTVAAEGQMKNVPFKVRTSSSRISAGISVFSPSVSSCEFSAAIPLSHSHLRR
jgi:hypothetical protein